MCLRACDMSVYGRALHRNWGPRDALRAVQRADGEIATRRRGRRMAPTSRRERVVANLFAACDRMPSEATGEAGGGGWSAGPT